MSFTTGRLVARWILANIVGWTLAGAFALPFGNVWRRAACGAVVGTAQWVALRRPLGMPPGWVAASCIGWIAGDWAGRTIASLFPYNINDLLNFWDVITRVMCLIGASGGAAAGLAQSWFFRRRASRPALWFAATIGGSLLGWSVGINVGFWVAGWAGTVAAFSSGGAALGTVAGAFSAAALFVMRPQLGLPESNQTK